MNEKTEKAKPESLGDKAIPRVRKSKLLIVDLAGSERINKSGLNSLPVHIITIHVISSSFIVSYMLFS
jgi:hypothetical protein